MLYPSVDGLLYLKYLDCVCIQVFGGLGPAGSSRDMGVVSSLSGSVSLQSLEDVGDDENTKY